MEREKEKDEWPSLSDAVSQRTDGRTAKNVKMNKKSNNDNNGVAGSAISKEIDSVSTFRKRNKKGQSKVNWTPMQIEPQPYKKRGTGRQNGFVRSTESNRKDMNPNEHSNGFDYPRRGYRGRSRRTHFQEVPQTAAIAENGMAYSFISPSVPDDSNDYRKPIIKYQMEYYFSDENLISDDFLRNKLINEGYVPLSEFLKFGQIKRFTQDVNLVKDSIKDSQQLEIQGDFVKRVAPIPVEWYASNNLHDHSNAAAYYHSSSNVSVNGDDPLLHLNDFNAHGNADNSHFADEDISNVAPLISQIKSINLNGATPLCSETEYSQNIEDQLSDTALCASPEVGIEMNGIYLPSAPATDCGDFSLPISNNPEDTNGYIYTEYDSNIFIYNQHSDANYYIYTNEMLSNNENNPENEIFQNISPEPAR